MNNTRVPPAVFMEPSLKTGGHVELLLLKNTQAETSEVLAKPRQAAQESERGVFFR